MDGRTRLDKWLWAARFFKTRSLAVQAIQNGRVRIDGDALKPARDVHVGDRLQLRIEQVEWEVVVLQLSEVRGPATVARTLYEETETSRTRREAERARRRLFVEPAAARDGGRPTKRDRRTIAQAGLPDAHWE